MLALRSVLLGAICILAFCRIAKSDNLLSCVIPRNVTIEISDHETVFLYQSQLTVRVRDDAMSVYSYPGINSVNVRADNVAVTFEGIIVYEDVKEHVLTQPVRMSVVYADRISGIAERIPQNSTDSTVHDCRLVLLPTERDRPNVHVRITNEIRRLAESCAELELCPRIGRVRPQDIMTVPSPSGSGLLSVYADPLAVTAPPPETNEAPGLKFSHGTVQSAINKLVDIALAEIIEKLREKNEGIVDVPNIDKRFSTGSGIFETTGSFEAVEGKLRDLTTIRRMTNATLTHSGMKFAASCGFGLDVLNLNYQRYRLKYGIIKVNGQMSAKIDGMALDARVAADYSQTPCAMELEELRVSEMGKMKIHITGLSPLNGMVSKLLGWVTQKWNEEIVTMIEAKLRKNVEARLATFNCERFRP